MKNPIKALILVAIFSVGGILIGTGHNIFADPLSEFMLWLILWAIIFSFYLIKKLINVFFNKKGLMSKNKIWGLSLITDLVLVVVVWLLI